MGIIYTPLRLANYARPDLEEIDANALVDTGALHLCIPQHVAIQLQLTEMGRREIKTADGQLHLIPYMAPVKIALLGRQCVTGALVFGDQVLLGAIPMEDMDLVIEPVQMRVRTNPLSPNIPMSLAMGIFPPHPPTSSPARGEEEHEVA
ncbi:MAG: clan AA aspartic protease [Magnetococcales bacterium]|nr:clan AA aspartic protease [Magnetococcales bacterium]